MRWIPRWLAWTMLALLAWGIWAVLSSRLGNAVTPGQSQALSTLGMAPILAALLFFREPHPTAQIKRGAAMAFLSGIFSSLGNLPFYAILSEGAKAATIVPLTALYPVVTILLALILLRERFSRVQALGIGLSIPALYLFNVQTDADGGGAAYSPVSSTMLLAMLSIGMWGVTGFLQKLCTNLISGSLSSVWFQLAFVPVGVILFAWEPLTAPLPGRTWMLVLMLGFTLALGNLAVLRAFACGGKASIIAPLSSLYPLVSIAIAVVGFGERVGWRESLAASLALAAVVALSYEAQPSTPKNPLANQNPTP